MTAKLFNLSGQHNARWSEKVGRQAMHESAAMRAIAIVSMLFLPGTFVCVSLPFPASRTKLISSGHFGHESILTGKYWIQRQSLQRSFAMVASYRHHRTTHCSDFDWLVYMAQED